MNRESSDRAVPLEAVMQLANKTPLTLRGTAASLLEKKGRAIHAIGPQDTVFDAISRMTDKRAGALLVIDDGRLLGVISERDYTRKVILQGLASKETRVEQIMSAPPISIAVTATLSECMQVMTARGIRHLPVLDGNTVAGVLSIGDLVRAVVEQQAETIDQLNAFVSADYPN
jgi:CBS domain-containing protein